MEEILKQIAKEFNGSFKENGLKGRKLWAVLTALRGPDDPVLPWLKEATTGIIRAKVGMKKSNIVGAVVTEDTPELRDRRKLVAANPSISRHFVSHAMNAFDALGLKWDEVNIF